MYWLKFTRRWEQSNRGIHSYECNRQHHVYIYTRLKHLHHHHHHWQLKVCDLFFSNDKEIISLKQCVINVVVVIGCAVAIAVAIDVASDFRREQKNYSRITRSYTKMYAKWRRFFFIFELWRSKQHSKWNSNEILYKCVSS